MEPTSSWRLCRVLNPLGHTEDSGIFVFFVCLFVCFLSFVVVVVAVVAISWAAPAAYGGPRLGVQSVL